MCSDELVEYYYEYDPRNGFYHSCFDSSIKSVIARADQLQRISSIKKCEDVSILLKTALIEWERKISLVKLTWKTSCGVFLKFCLSNIVKLK